MWRCSCSHAGASGPFCDLAHLQGDPEGWGHGPRWVLASRKSEWMSGRGALGLQIAKEVIISNLLWGQGGEGVYSEDSVCARTMSRLDSFPKAALCSDPIIVTIY